MAPSKSTAQELSVQLNIETSVLTATAVADVVNALLEFLLYQRNQIPFIYKTFKYYVSEWSEEDYKYAGICTTNHLTKLALRRQREHAKQTMDTISSMQQLIQFSLENNSVNCLRFLFGSTTFTPKEIYIVHIPTRDIARNHYLQNQHLPDSCLNKTLISLLTCEELFTMFSNALSTTNMFLELEMLADSCEFNQQNMFPKDMCQLPMSCKEIHLQLIHAPSESTISSIQCCTDLKVFEDLTDLNTKHTHHNSSESEQKDRNIAQRRLTWWEADIIVRGFKEKSVNGVNLWSK